MKRTPESHAAQESRPQPGKFRAIFLAVLVHALFLALIVFGVTWQNTPSAPVQAELWDKLPAVNPAPAVKPPPKAEPKPEPPKPEPPKPEPPKPEPPKPEPPKAEFPKPLSEAKPEPPKPDPAIAEKAEREKRAQEQREKAERQREEQARKKREQEEAAKKKKQQEEAARKKQEQEDALRKKREDDRRRQEDERARAAAEQQRLAAAQARQSEIDRYIDGIKRKILSRANVPDTVPTGTEVSVRIRILPGGDVLNITVTRSASPTYSAAIERAIRSAAPLPVPPANSELFSQFRDLNLNFRHER